MNNAAGVSIAACYGIVGRLHRCQKRIPLPENFCLLAGQFEI